MAGVVRLGYEVEERAGPEAEFELKLVTKRVERTRAVLKIEGRYFRDNLEVEDAYLDYKLSERMHLQLGVNKKRLGLEYQQSSRRRLTPKRSMIYRELEELGIVGRQLNLRLVSEPIDDLSVDALVGTDGSRNTNVAVHVGRRHGTLGYGYWGLLEAHRVDKGYIPVTAHALSGWLISDQFRVVVELIGGIDSFETEANELFAEGRRVWFFGPKLEFAYQLRIGERFAIEPLAQASLAVHDAASPRYNTLQLLGGFNLYYRRIAVALNVEYIGATERTEPNQRTARRRPNLYAQVKFHF